ncbi:MAG: hypothetical protein HQK97_07580 [Nitrospirae bacterium]|nr:hypothetical protein [Nitrospirota bacterium]
MTDTHVSMEACRECQKRQDERHVHFDNSLDELNGDLKDFWKELKAFQQELKQFKESINSMFGKLYMLIGSVLITLIANLFLEYLKKWGH